MLIEHVQTLPDYSGLSASRRFLVRSLLNFVLIAELLGLTEPDAIRTPLSKLIETCDFRVYICPCGFYCQNEFLWSAHYRYHHQVAKEILKKCQRGGSAN